MKGDFSRFTFNKDRRFTRVLKQQGRVDLDADWNEQSAIETYQTVTRTRDVIGPSGAPRDAFPNSPGGRGSFAVFFENNRLRIAPGRFYVEGLLCELDSAVDFTNQPHHKPVAPVPADQARDFLFLDVWERHITAVEDPSLREVALGGPDTATRVQTIWQVKARRLTANQAFDCKTGWQTLLPAASTGRLTVAHENNPQPGSECDLSPTGGYRGLENRLYRVEIHKAGSSTTATFKWSRDNGAVLYPAASVSEGGGGAAPRRVRLTQTGRDELLSIRRGDWVEVTSDTRDLLHQPGTLTRVDDLDQAGTVLILTDDVSVHFLEQGLKVRRWDQAGPALPLTPGPVLLEDGIRVTFSAGSYNTGDYWTFAARAAVRDNSTGEVEAINNALPQGILHSYAPLGLVTWSTPANLPVAAQITDCRPLFPPLTDLRASDVSYDNSKCQLPGVKTVQQAIDQLCQQHEGACTFVIKPGQDLQAIVDQIPAGGDASICFQAGSYVLSQSVIFKGKGHLKLTGASKATQLIINKAEAALVFEGCESVLVRDLSAESRAQGAIIPHLNGVLTFISCGEVSVEAVELRTSHDTDTAAAGLAVRPSSENTPGARQVRVLHSRFFVGNDQLGILLVNVERSQVEDNLMEVVEFPGAVRLQDLVRGRRSRARLSSLLMSNAKTSAGEPAAGGVQNVAVRIGDNMVNFTTAAALRKVWQPLITLFPAQNIADARSAQLYVQKLAGRILTDERVRNAIPALREFINALLRDAAASAAAGVTVAGKLAAETRILNNTILGFRQGVHIGLSHRELQRGAPDLAGLVTIAGNRVVCRLTFDSLLEQRHGIFVGNAASTLIENNRIHLDRRAGAERYEVQGILLHGVFGPRLLVRQNHLGFFRVGILVVPIGSPSVPLQNRLWVVAENLAERAAAVVQAPATVKQVDNVMT